MSVRKPLYGSVNQTLTITLNSLGNNLARSCVAIDNTGGSALFDDVLVTVKVTTAASGVSATGMVLVYAYGSTDGGSTYGGGETGMSSDATVTIVSGISTPNLILIGSINANAVNGVFQRTGMSVAAAFGGVMPAQWGILVVNLTGAALAASGCSANYQGFQEQIV